MQTQTYDGPRNGDYVRYVDQLLSASPSYRSYRASVALATGQTLSKAGRKHADVQGTPGAPGALTPGGQSPSLAQRLRDQLRAAAEKAQAEIQRAREAAEAGQGSSRAGTAGPAQPQSAQGHAGSRPADKEQDQGKKNAWLFPIIFAVVLSMIFPALAPFIIAITVINAIRKGMGKGLKDARQDTKQGAGQQPRR
ncbi:hypothetical protein [Comamonas composti]|uniref:hypothetical protein n=1 Tax=Comamonas composti TaxID=408558 RepID=UPI00041D6802|nr:hypothetical protein [Comamonas composti]